MDKSDEEVLLTPSGEGEEHAAADSATRSWRRWVSGVVTVGVCIAYTLVGPLLIMLNKLILTKSDFPYPILLTSFHQLTSSLFAAIFVRVLRVIPMQHGDMTWGFWRNNVLVVGVATTAALSTGNSSYMYLTVAFIEILKGFTPVVTMMVQTVFGEPFPRPAIALAVLCISLGTAVSSFGELHLNWTGLCLMLLSVYCESMRLMLTQARAARPAPSALSPQAEQPRPPQRHGDVRRRPRPHLTPCVRGVPRLRPPHSQRMLQKLEFHVLEGLYFMAPVRHPLP